MKKLILVSSMTMFFILLIFNVSAQNPVNENIKDKGLNAAGSLFKKKDKGEKQQQTTESTETDNNSGTPNEETTATVPAKQEAPQTLSSFSKFDFVPGEKVIFYEDFSQDALADFPALWNTNGSGEVTTTNLYPGNWFKMKAGSAFVPELTIPFNENFTFECDLIFKDVPTSESTEGLDIYFIDASPEWKVGDNYSNGSTVSLFKGGALAQTWYNDAEFFTSGTQPIPGEDMTVKSRISIWIQKQRLRLYVDDAKILDLPRLLAPGMKFNKIQFLSSSFEGHNSLMGNVRIAYGAPDTRNKLLTTGKLVTYGITFDVNSDKIKPESYGTLKEIAAVLKENASVKVKIVGHTDADGDAAKNMDLSKQRAASVKNELAKEFGIDISRMETEGKGKTEPVAPNDTQANKAQNRRVEFIKL
jgi:OmpA-OmpF porin, OOP family